MKKSGWVRFFVTHQRSPDPSADISATQFAGGLNAVLVQVDLDHSPPLQLAVWGVLAESDEHFPAVQAPDRSGIDLDVLSGFPDFHQRPGVTRRVGHGAYNFGSFWDCGGPQSPVA
ncbi:MAG: hypothetical protein HQM00_05515 [Magnetococcales bacterium]|nr:hypothetical protein [Magnetococcales bacterium]